MPSFFYIKKKKAIVGKTQKTRHHQQFQNDMLFTYFKKNKIVRLDRLTCLVFFKTKTKKRAKHKRADIVAPSCFIFN